MTIQLETIIAAACEAARNPFSSAHVSMAHGNLIETAIKNQPPAWSMTAPAPASFDDAKQYLERLALAFDEIAYQVAREANDNSTISVSTPRSLFSDALSDSGLLSELDDAAERCREDSLEVA
jgi:hypothetical protein